MHRDDAEKADELGLTPLVRLVSWGSAGVAPNIMGIGPVPATEAALAKAGLSLSDIDLIELNEAFAAQALAVMREWEFAAADHDRTNVHGSGISLGHPVGATGGRMLATLARELNRREARYGLETMCIGGGQGLAAVFERNPRPVHVRPVAVSRGESPLAHHRQRLRGERLVELDQVDVVQPQAGFGECHAQSREPGRCP